jgi:peptidyl-tRNA hydrolase
MNPLGMDSAKYVLQRFSDEERKLFDAGVRRAADAVGFWISGAGVEACMNRYN